jgi:hypothetical protein
MFKLILGIVLLLIIIFIYTGLGVLTREIFADKKCDTNPPPPDPPTTTKAPATTKVPAITNAPATTNAPAPFNNITEGFSSNAVKLDLNEHELVFSKGAIVLLWIIVIISTIASVSALSII